MLISTTLMKRHSIPTYLLLHNYRDALQLFRFALFDWSLQTHDLRFLFVHTCDFFKLHVLAQNMDVALAYLCPRPSRSVALARQIIAQRFVLLTLSIRQISCVSWP